MANWYRGKNGRMVSNDYYATERQLWYLKKLLNEAFAAHFAHSLCLDPNHLSDRLPKAEASRAIDTLVKAKANNWK